MKRWFYSKDSAQQGPVLEEDLVGMIQTGELPDSTLVWTEGMAGWAAAKELPQVFGKQVPVVEPVKAVASGVVDEKPSEGEPFSPYAPPTVSSEAPVVPVETSGPQVRPWIRFWVRTIDIVIIGFSLGIVLGFTYPELLDSMEAVLNIVVLLVGTVVEATWFALFGTTPGKAIFRISVRRSDGCRLSFVEALVRSFKVFVKGLGLGIPLVALITHIVGYSTLSNQGISSWDREASLVVSHREIQAWRWLLIFMILGASIGLIGYGSSLE